MKSMLFSFLALAGGVALSGATHTTGGCGQCCILTAPVSNCSTDADCCYPGSPCCYPGSPCCDGGCAAEKASCCPDGACCPDGTCCSGKAKTELTADCCFPGSPCCVPGAACCGGK